MRSLLDEALKEKYHINVIHDPLIYMKDAIDWSVFPELLKDLYHNNTAPGGGRPNILITSMEKVLFSQSMYNPVDEQVEKEIKDRISFMNFLGFPEHLPDSTTIWLFRERLSINDRDRTVWNELHRQNESRGLKVKHGPAQMPHSLPLMLDLRSTMSPERT